MSTSPGGHIPVLLQECLAILNPQPDEVFLDGTAGLGGHAAAIAARLGPGGTLVLCDLDRGNLTSAAARVRSLPNAPTVIEYHGSFAEGPRVAAGKGLLIDGLLVDLGFASTQVDDAARGLSFSRPGPLDMRLDQTRGPTAADLVNSLPENELADLIFRWGEERQSRAIARRIVERRSAGSEGHGGGGGPITRTDELADVIRSVVRRTPGKQGGGGIDPATRTFQALRIAVNDELGHLGALLDQVQPGPPFRAGARVGVISFHSLEDRPVKQAFAGLVSRGEAEALTTKPATPGAEELGRNPRAGSAKLRAIRLGGAARRA